MGRLIILFLMVTVCNFGAKNICSSQFQVGSSKQQYGPGCLYLEKDYRILLLEIVQKDKANSLSQNKIDFLEKKILVLEWEKLSMDRISTEHKGLKAERQAIYTERQKLQEEKAQLYNDMFKITQRSNKNLRRSNQFLRRFVLPLSLLTGAVAGLKFSNIF